jgi:hypothetical protein
MIRIILSVPATTTAAELSAVLPQYVCPMPGTVEFAGLLLADALVPASFDPGDLDWPVLGAWSWTGGDLRTMMQPDEAALMDHMPTPTGEDGSPTGAPSALSETHRWAGWPQSF